MNNLQKLYKAMIEARNKFNQIKRANIQGHALTESLRNLASATNAYAHAFAKVCGR